MPGTAVSAAALLSVPQPAAAGGGGRGPRHRRAAGERGGALRALRAGSAPAGTAAPRGTLRAGGALLAASPAPGVHRAVWAAGGRAGPVRPLSARSVGFGRTYLRAVRKALGCYFP